MDGNRPRSPSAPSFVAPGNSSHRSPTPRPAGVRVVSQEHVRAQLCRVRTVQTPIGASERIAAWSGSALNAACQGVSGRAPSANRINSIASAGSSPARHEASRISEDGRSRTVHSSPKPSALSSTSRDSSARSVRDDQARLLAASTRARSACGSSMALSLAPRSCPDSSRSVRFGCGRQRSPPVTVVLIDELRGPQPMLPVAIDIHGPPGLATSFVRSAQQLVHRPGAVRHRGRK